MSAPLDAELAIDTTGSMAPSIRRIQRDTEKLVKSIRKMSPGAHVALVQFKDSGDTPEYELFESMTGDWKSLDIAAAQLGPGGDNPEAYNVVFRLPRWRRQGCGQRPDRRDALARLARGLARAGAREACGAGEDHVVADDEAQRRHGA